MLMRLPLGIGSSPTGSAGSPASTHGLVTLSLTHVAVAGTKHPPLLWGFGVSLVERAVIDAFCRASGQPFARALNDGLDGPALGADPGEDDSRGQVTYRGGDPAQPREVYIYITHQ